MNKIENFRGKYYFLSNFSRIPVTLEKITYPTSEHAYQAYKTENINEREKISKLNTPAKAKKYGNKLELRENWDSIKLEIMENIVHQKLLQNPNYLKKLIETGDAELIEGNTWKDTFWGVYKGTGQNHLGKILMKIREELKDHKLP